MSERALTNWMEYTSPNENKYTQNKHIAAPGIGMFILHTMKFYAF